MDLGVVPAQSTESQTHAHPAGLCFGSEPARFQRAPREPVPPISSTFSPLTNLELVLVVIIIEAV